MLAPRGRYVRAFAARIGGVGHVLDRFEGRLLCGGRFAWAFDLRNPEPENGDCRRCLAILTARLWRADPGFVSRCCEAPVLVRRFSYARKCSKCGRAIDATKFGHESEMLRVER